MWLGRSVRGRGIGVRALRLLLDEAARTGARRVVAETTAENAAAITVLRRCSAVLVFDGTQVHAEIPVRPAGVEHVSKPDGY
jgi:RimJ/RimL family protein N-acetyltransferase